MTMRWVATGCVLVALGALGACGRTSEAAGGAGQAAASAAAPAVRAQAVPLGSDGSVLTVGGLLKVVEVQYTPSLMLNDKPAVLPGADGASVLSIEQVFRLPAADIVRITGSIGNSAGIDVLAAVSKDGSIREVKNFGGENASELHLEPGTSEDVVVTATRHASRYKRVHTTWSITPQLAKQLSERVDDPVAAAMRGPLRTAAPAESLASAPAYELWTLPAVRKVFQRLEFRAPKECVDGFFNTAPVLSKDADGSVTSRLNGSNAEGGQFGYVHAKGDHVTELLICGSGAAGDPATLFIASDTPVDQPLTFGIPPRSDAVVDGPAVRVDGVERPYAPVIPFQRALGGYKVE